MVLFLALKNYRQKLELISFFFKKKYMIKVGTFRELIPKRRQESINVLFKTPFQKSQSQGKLLPGHKLTI